MVEKGLVPGYEMEDFQASLADQEAEIENARERLDLRKQFVAGNLSAQEVEIQGRITVAEGKLRRAKSMVNSLKKQMDRAQALTAKGLTPDASVDGLLFGLNAAQAELTLATLEIDILKKVK
jgi:outer membrane protein TolC